VPDAWDTTVASRAHAGGRHEALFRAHVAADHPVSLPAPAVQEVARGLHAHARQNPRIWHWIGSFERFVSDPLIEVVPFDGDSALLAGALHGRLPHPPTGKHRHTGTRAQQRSAWAFDIQIAACAFANGYGVLTENVHDFTVLREAISELVPGVPPLDVRDARELAEAPA
jgi:predicted nucleic acid-binding protein